MAKQPTLSQSLGPEQSGRLIAHYGTTLIVENQVGQLYRCHFRQNLGTLVTGDDLIFQSIDEKTGIVIACLPRRSTITRPDKRSAKPVVANVDILIIVIALEPLPRQTTLDRYLIMAQSLKLPALIVLNKCDLNDFSTHSVLSSQCAVYQTLGYPWLEVSCKTRTGLDQLAQLLQNKTGVLLGQSGVGKSSLLNALVPNAQVFTQELSQIHRFGRHTTTASRLYHLPQGGDIIDSPGIHEFNLRHLSTSTILQGYPEFLPLLGQCQFRNCKHTTGKGCALQEAAKLGKIAPFRLENYHKIIDDLIV